jgi:diaminopimelate decarboxylase
MGFFNSRYNELRNKPSAAACKPPRHTSLREVQPNSTAQRATRFPQKLFARNLRKRVIVRTSHATRRSAYTRKQPKLAVYLHRYTKTANGEQRPMKKLPLSEQQIATLTEQVPTPFYLYDEAGIRASVRALRQAFAWADFHEHFAVKATPNPYILSILRSEGCGADASSLAELILAERVGLRGEQIMFTSNDTPASEFGKARQLGAIINLDDISHIDFLAQQAGMPQLVCFRYNPGPERTGNAIIGTPSEAKYGLTRKQLFEAYAHARELGATRFGLHTMVASNELDRSYFVETARMLFELVVELRRELGIRCEFVNLGGGIGIPYRPEQEPVDLDALGQEVQALYQQIIVANGLKPLQIHMECGRLITGPHGYLVSKVRHIKHTYKSFVGLDACMADLMRPALYGAYHHISVLGKQNAPAAARYDVTGSLCENNDKFAIDRELPEIAVGDTLVIHDAGAHGHAMGFNYNGKLRHAEYLLREDGTILQIRRAETLDDYFATLDFAGLADFSA